MHLICEKVYSQFVTAVSFDVYRSDEYTVVRVNLQVGSASALR